MKFYRILKRHEQRCALLSDWVRSFITRYGGVSLVSLHISTLKNMFSLKMTQKYHNLSEPETLKAKRIVRFENSLMILKLNTRDVGLHLEN